MAQGFGDIGWAETLVLCPGDIHGFRRLVYSHVIIFLRSFLGETLRWSREKCSSFASERSTLTRLSLKAEPGVSFRLSLWLWQARLILWEGFSHALAVPIVTTKFSFIGWIISDATRTPLKSDLRSWSGSNYNPSSFKHSFKCLLNCDLISSIVAHSSVVNHFLIVWKVWRVSNKSFVS